MCVFVCECLLVLFKKKTTTTRENKSIIKIDRYLYGLINWYLFVSFDVFVVNGRLLFVLSYVSTLKCILNEQMEVQGKEWQRNASDLIWFRWIGTKWPFHQHNEWRKRNLHPCACHFGLITINKWSSSAYYHQRPLDMISGVIIKWHWICMGWRERGWLNSAHVLSFLMIQANTLVRLLHTIQPNGLAYTPQYSSRRKKNWYGLWPISSFSKAIWDNKNIVKHLYTEFDMICSFFLVWVCACVSAFSGWFNLFLGKYGAITSFPYVLGIMSLVGFGWKWIEIKYAAHFF